MSFLEYLALSIESEMSEYFLLFPSYLFVPLLTILAVRCQADLRFNGRRQEKETVDRKDWK